MDFPLLRTDTFKNIKEETLDLLALGSLTAVAGHIMKVTLLPSTNVSALVVFVVVASVANEVLKKFKSTYDGRTIGSLVIGFVACRYYLAPALNLYSVVALSALAVATNCYLVKKFV